jgi:hypothetical protein
MADEATLAGGHRLSLSVCASAALGFRSYTVLSCSILASIDVPKAAWLLSVAVDDDQRMGFRL